MESWEMQPVQSPGSEARPSLFLLPLSDFFPLVSRTLNTFWYSIRLAIQSRSSSFLFSAYTFYFILFCMSLHYVYCFL